MRTYDDSFSGQKIYPGKVRGVQTVCTFSCRLIVELIRLD